MCRRSIWKRPLKVDTPLVVGDISTPQGVGDIAGEHWEGSNTPQGMGDILGEIINNQYMGPFKIVLAKIYCCGFIGVFWIYLQFLGHIPGNIRSG